MSSPEPFSKLRWQVETDRLHFSVGFQVNPQKIKTSDDRRLYYALQTRKKYGMYLKVV